MFVSTKPSFAGLLAVFVGQSSEAISSKIQMIKITNAGLGRAKQFVWGKGFALPRLISRPQEGSGEECGRDFGPGFFFFSPMIKYIC
ncbi:MAG: hypothetical protein R3B39_03045 [Candidatus Paceibacterota bacterium]